MLTDYKGIPGYCDYVGYLQNDLAPRLIERLKSCPYGKLHILEIGCLFGASACALRDGLNAALRSAGSDLAWCYHIFSLDRFSTSEQHRGSSNPEVSNIIKEHGGHFKAAWSFISEHARELDAVDHKRGQISLIDCDALVYLGGADKRKMDFVFLDSDHSYEHLSQEIKLCSGWLEEDGILAGHDYASWWPGVVKAVDEKFPGSIHRVGSVWETQVVK